MNLTTSDWIAGIAAIVAVAALLMQWGSSYQATERAKVLSSLDLMTSDAIADARSIVGAAARLPSLDAEETKKFVDAAFRLMWAVQRSTFAAKTIRKTALAPDEAKWLYRHVDSITKDLANAIMKHGHGVAWEPTLKHTNEVLEILPKKVKNEWSRAVGHKNFTLLSNP